VGQVQVRYPRAAFERSVLDQTPIDPGPSCRRYHIHTNRPSIWESSGGAECC